MKRILAAVLCLLFPLAVLASESGYKVKYDGGSLTGFKTGEDLRLELVGNEIHLMRKHELVQTIPASAVTEISYGQDVHRRIGAALGQLVTQRAALRCNATKTTTVAFWLGLKV